MFSSYFTQIAGIIGGVGPEATNYFTSLLVKQRGTVKKDQDHIPYLLFNNPQIPDRSRYILYGGENPLPEIINTGLFLKNAGATFLTIPCNTAHTFTQKIEETVGLPVVNMIELTAKHIKKTYGENIQVGLLATNGTIKSNTYQNFFKDISPSISVLVPNEKKQSKVMKAIYEIKKFSSDEQSFNLLNNAAQELIQRGASVIILGCTEIPLALTQEKCNFIVVDPVEILADKVIELTLQSSTNSYPKIWNKSRIGKTSHIRRNLPEIDPSI